MEQPLKRMVRTFPLASSNSTLIYPDVKNAPTFALGDASGISTAVLYTIALVDTTCANARALHFVQTDFAFAFDIVKLASGTAPLLAYQAPGSFKQETGASRNYSFLMWQQPGNKNISTLKMPATGATVDIAKFQSDNGFQAAQAGLAMVVQLGQGSGPPDCNAAGATASSSATSAAKSSAASATPSAAPTASAGSSSGPNPPSVPPAAIAPPPKSMSMAPAPPDASAPSASSGGGASPTATASAGGPTESVAASAESTAASAGSTAAPSAGVTRSAGTNGTATASTPAVQAASEAGSWLRRDGSGVTTKMIALAMVVLVGSTRSLW